MHSNTKNESPFQVGMLILGKSHSRVESRNSRVSTETLDFAGVRTYYRHDRSRIAGGGAKREDRAIAGQPKMPDSITAGKRLIDSEW